MPTYGHDGSSEKWTLGTIAWLVGRGARGQLQHPAYTREQMLVKVRLANRRLARLRWPWDENPKWERRTH